MSVLTEPMVGTAGDGVVIRDVSKVHGRPGRGGVLALDRVDLEVARGELLCLVGASGCGKSTLLDLLAGLSIPTAGEVRVAGPTALLFQEAALFPWLTAQRNVELALRLRGVGRRERRDRARELLARVDLTGFEDHRPYQLSGGMRQRVALARALAQEADVLLIDEPFGALDAITRDLLHDELESLWLAAGLTVVFVTHNVREAVRLGDRVVILASRPGRIAGSFRVDLPRPRSISDPDVAQLSTTVTEVLREEVERDAASR